MDSEVTTEIYLAERVRSELARDPDVGRLGIEVEVAGARIVLSGEVATYERKRSLLAAVGRIAPGRELEDRIRVRTLREPEHEVLP